MLPLLFGYFCCLWTLSVALGQTDNKTAPIPFRTLTPLLDTPWTKHVNTKSNPWPEYPRPLLRRESWQTLNGIWTYQAASGDEGLITPPYFPLAEEVRIPFCIESALSGIMAFDVTHIWFATPFTLPSGWAGQRVLLHFEAVDYETDVFLNGEHVGFNRGGYFRFRIAEEGKEHMGKGIQLESADRHSHGQSSNGLKTEP